LKTRPAEFTPEVRDDTSVQASVQTTVQLVLEPVLGLVFGLALGLILGLIFSRTATNPDSSTSRDSEASSLWYSIVTLLSLSKDDMAIHYFDVSNSMTSKEQRTCQPMFHQTSQPQSQGISQA
jgi:hypothetical protein